MFALWTRYRVLESCKQGVYVVTTMFEVVQNPKGLYKEWS